MTDIQVNWLTQEAYDRLKAELDQLIAHRPIIAAEINDRREEGDLRENGGYHAAREEQGQAGGPHSSAAGASQQRQGRRGTQAVRRRAARLGRHGRTMKPTRPNETFLIATRQEGVSDGKLEVYSPHSPLGAALIDAKVGEKRSFTVPNGNVIKVTLKKAEPYHS